MPIRGGAYWIMAIAWGVLASMPTASADDLSLDAQARASRLSAVPDVSIPQNAKPGTDQGASDIQSKVDDLEATKAAVNHGVGPAVSLSVSGWVGEQVIMAK
jgi:hypothetical protein